MGHALVTIVAPLDPGLLTTARAAITALGNPPRPDIAEKLQALDEDFGVHFVSLHALESFTAGHAYLLLEFSADRDQRSAIKQLAAAIGADLTPIFALARGGRDAPIEVFLRRSAIAPGFGLFAHPGLGHIGSPNMTVGRIRRERDLFIDASAILTAQPGGMRALDRLDAVRRALPLRHAEMLALADPPPQTSASGTGAAVTAVIGGAFKTYLWPLLVLLGLAWLGGVALATHAAIKLQAWAVTVPATTVPLDDRWWLLGGHGALVEHLIPVGLGLAVKLVLGLVVGLLIVAGILYARLRQQENSDWISSRAPDRATLHAIFARENQPGFAHNHMISLTERKPGWLRYFTQRLIFFAIATIGPRLYKPGYLGEIGTIHFARWITVPGTRDLVFLSNYGGSWEAYLEDFITLAHNGLTGVWSNTVGFPKTTNLVNDGATDGERFKRYARQSMLPTLFWYSAYPDLDTDMIRANAEIRRGLSSAMTEDAAQLWLSHFGSTKRPDSKFVTNEIQSLVFGGLGFLPAATATFWRVPAEQGEARAWLAGVSEYIAWSDGRRFQDNAAVPAIVQLGLSAPGLAALGLPDEGLASFPPAFLDGMAARARILGDSEASDPAYWWWSEPADAALIIYGESALAVDTLHKRLAALATMHGARLVHEVPLRDLPPQQPVLVSAEDTASGNARHAIQRHDPEPFGFADGISQPLIAGTYKAERPQAHPLHIVAPGEFVLGYPDNRGNRPPGPTLAPIHDPTNILPVFDDDASGPVGDVNRPRDLGRNGTFLVIRQLEQDVEAFHAYCKEQSAKLQATYRLSPPYIVTPEFIGAKLVGRWQNGAPLVRSAYSQSATPSIIAENAFMPGFEDPEGLRCPFGAHVRRSNPRDSLNPGSTDQIEISNRHRLLRVGRKYDPAPNQKPGILFMCLNSDLERQFEFVQQTWLNGNVISLSCPTNLAGERDPILAGGQPNSGFTVPTRDGPVKLDSLPTLVTMRGGGYFFLPGKRLVQYLCGAVE
uniref:Dyp-type peroxidase n=1 Tax=uncultured Sphingomonas sp. TaxID=158754 RepID=UPI0035CCA219